MVEEVMLKANNPAKTNRSSEKPTGLIAHKTVSFGEPERNIIGCWTKVERKRTVSQKLVSPTAVLATKMETNGMTTQRSRKWTGQ